MIKHSRATKDFWRAYESLPPEVRKRADTAYRLWRQSPQHSSLDFKRVNAMEPVCSVRIGLRWRALGLLEGDTVVWFWIGSHAEYDRILGKL